MLAGGTAGVAMWSLAIPPDVRILYRILPSGPKDKVQEGTLTRQTIKSRLQSAPHGTYSGFMDCARKLIAADGVAALWKGFGPAMARAFPANVSRTVFGLICMMRMGWV